MCRGACPRHRLPGARQADHDHRALRRRWRYRHRGAFDGSRAGKGAGDAGRSRQQARGSFPGWLDGASEIKTGRLHPFVRGASHGGHPLRGARPRRDVFAIELPTGGDAPLRSPDDLGAR